MLSLRQPIREAPRRRNDGWAWCAATAFTGVSFAVVLHSMRPHPVAADGVVVRNRTPAGERIVYVAPRTASAPARAHHAALGGARPAALLVSPPRDTASAPVLNADPAVTGAAPPSALPSSAATAPSARLMPSRAVGAEWYVRTLPRNPFVSAAEPLSGERRDSTLSALGTSVPELAARRVQSQGERDASSKEAMLKIHLSGRALLVPPDNSGGMITGSIPIPFFGGAAAANRARDSRLLAETRARYARLRQRADSMRRAVGDTLPR